MSSSDEDENELKSPVAISAAEAGATIEESKEPKKRAKIDVNAVPEVDITALVVAKECNEVARFDRETAYDTK